MRQRSEEFGFSIWWSVLALIVVAILTFGGLLINQYALPWQMSNRREAVQESKSFIDSTNSNLANLKSEYSRLQTKIAESEKPDVIAAYEAQQKAVLGQMCTIVGTMDRSSVNQSTLSFLSEKGGC